MTQSIPAERRLIKTVIVEDHDVLRESFCDSFSEGKGFQVMDSTASADLADILCNRHHPDLVLMDVCTASGASGLDALRRLRPKYPDMKIVMMSGFNELSYSPRAREYGANAFIFKSKSYDFFFEIIDKIMDGEYYFPEDRKIPLPNGETPFTDREMEILRQLSMFKPRSVIAEELFISENTLKRHIGNMLGKSGFSAIAELVIYVVSNGWINPNY